MATPAKKSPAIDQTLESIGQQLWGRSRVECINKGICVCCGQAAAQFANRLSEKEFTISGMCQACQDETFGRDY